MTDHDAILEGAEKAGLVEVCEQDGQQIMRLRPSAVVDRHSSPVVGGTQANDEPPRKGRRGAEAPQR